MSDQEQLEHEVADAGFRAGFAAGARAMREHLAQHFENPSNILGPSGALLARAIAGTIREIPTVEPPENTPE